jgi:hypothetical protein
MLPARPGPSLSIGTTCQVDQTGLLITVIKLDLKTGLIEPRSIRIKDGKSKETGHLLPHVVSEIFDQMAIGFMKMVQAEHQAATCVPAKHLVPDEILSLCAGKNPETFHHDHRLLHLSMRHNKARSKCLSILLGRP